MLQIGVWHGRSTCREKPSQKGAVLTNLSELSHSLSHPEKGHGMLLQVEHCLQRNSWIEISVINISKYLLIHLQCLNCVSKVKISNRFTKHPFRKFQFALCCNAFMKQKYIYIITTVHPLKVNMWKCLKSSNHFALFTKLPEDHKKATTDTKNKVHSFRQQKQAAL